MATPTAKPPRQRMAKGMRVNTDVLHSVPATTFHWEVVTLSFAPVSFVSIVCVVDTVVVLLAVVADSVVVARSVRGARVTSLPSGARTTRALDTVVWLISTCSRGVSSRTPCQESAAAR